MMKINSLTLIPMMFFGILLFSSPTFSQDHSDQTQITRSDYISMDKQVSILEFRVKELEKNSDKIDGLKIENLGNKADIQFLYKIFLSWYFIVALMIGFISIGIGIFAYNKTKSMAAEQCEKWLKAHKKEILKSIEKPTKSWLTENKNKVFQKFKDIQLVDSIPSIDLKNNQDFDFTIPHKSEEEQEAAELFEKAINSHGIEKISTYLKLIGQFKDSKNEKILIVVARSYFNLAITLEGQDQIDTYRELINQFKNSQSEKILIVVTKSYFNLALSLEGKDQIDTYRELINQFKNRQNEGMLIQVAKAYVNLANKLINTNQRNEAIPLLSEVIKQFKNSNHQEIKLQLAKMEFLYNSLLQNS